MNRAKTYFISAGEHSGDLLAAELVKELKKQLPDFEPFGVAGSNMKSQGVRQIIDQNDLSVMGFFEVLKKLPYIHKIRSNILSEIRKSHPQFAILVDYPGFHFNLAKKIKALNIPVIQYVSPQVWAWKKNRIKKMKKLFVLILGILPFESDFFKGSGLNYIYVGSPLKDRIENMGLPEKYSKRVVGFFPGSRLHEVKKNIPEIVRIIDHLSNEDLLFIINIASSLDENQFKGMIGESSNIRFSYGNSLELMASCDVAVVASGTATLECGLIGTPMTVIYKMNPFSFFLAKRLVKLKYISLINLTLGGSFVKEFIQDFNPKDVAAEILSLLNDDKKRNFIKDKFLKLKTNLKGKASLTAACEIKKALYETK